MNGWMGRILRVDLTGALVREERLDAQVWSRYLGGRGYGARVLYDETGSRVDPLSPDNLLIFATGPLTGTKAPTPSRYSLTTKSPLTGTICDNNSGGKWGVQLKRSGYDALIIAGKSIEPVYMSIRDGKAEIKPASGLWGKDTRATTELLKAQEGENASVICIGPAGENGVLISCIMNDGARALARGGCGAVMGSKNLKAIVTQGSGRPEIADEEKMKFFTYEANKLVRAHPMTSKGLPELGTALLMDVVNAAGMLPTRNFQESRFAGSDRVSGAAIQENIFRGRTGCYGCVIRCTRRTRTRTQEGEGPEYESAWAFGPDCGIDDLEAVAEANYLCNLLGLDTISTGGTIACAMELQERGIADTGIRFGQKEELHEIIRKIAYREGIGDGLAEGSRRFAAGYGAKEFSMQVKGLELPGYDPRGAQGQGLGYATSNRGGCHLRGGYLVASEVLGAPRMVNRFVSVGKAGHVAQAQNFGAAADSLVVCRFATFALSETVLARLLSAVTGIEYEPEDLMRIGERIFNLERMYNIREGFGMADDDLPGRLKEEPVRSGPSEGSVVRLPEMIEEYYEFRQWDEKGIPTEAKLKSLHLEGLADER